MSMRRLSMCLLLTVWLVSNHLVGAQNNSGASIDPFEGGALNSIFAAWNLPAPKEWNTTGDLCSGVAIDANVTVDTESYNPLIKCDCTFLNSTICHVTALKVYAKDVRGPIPQELWTFEYLTYLNLSKNSLTGVLPPAIANLTRLKWLTFAINSLSGPVPKEIGLLTNLTTLSLSSNEFSGPIPPDIGNCTKLESLYIDSSGMSGQIPLSFANLLGLKEAWITDMEITGQIPDFIGGWTELTNLRIFGTALSGPIPSSFANLTSLIELRLGDISNGSSSLEFIKYMKSLSILVLRNSNLTGTIPSDIGDDINLLHVDLSFNKLTGSIPASLFNLSRLTYLFLGNNTLNGSLPIHKSPSLISIDVSYNDLSGSLPSWAIDFNLNPVANNFELKDQNSSNMTGLDCLQKNFLCKKGKGGYDSFSINCGGPQKKTNGGVLYESDENDLGPASFFVSDTQRWAVSSVGIFAGSSSNIYNARSTASFLAQDSALFQTARLSASSLRYYGLGLQSGNYTVKLQFSELQILGSNSWTGTGRRRFDIYVQGRLVEKDFDIRKSANDSTTTGVRISSYNASVSKGYLEIHLFWAGKGTCCIPMQGAYGISISAISVTLNFTPTLRQNHRDRSNRSILVGVIAGVGILIILVGVVIFIFQRRRKRYTDDEELLAMDIKPNTYTYSELRSATQDFHFSNKLGEGGFGAVYKGKLNDGRMVAVKQLSVASRQGKGQFVAEIATISAVQHRNLVKLYGCCFEGDHRLLAYEYLPNGSLDQALFGETTLHLDWSTRYEICLGVARGLLYLHEEARVRIVHRDVKASNILLDSTLVPKISDFGLAKLYDDKKTHMSTRVAGTIGYLAPEYAMRGHLTEKSDVYAFGVVVLELVSGRPNSDVNLEKEKRYLLEWAWNLHEKGREVELIDDELSEVNMEQVKRMIGVALLCTQTNHVSRPAMSKVLVMLSGDVEVKDISGKPGLLLTDWRFDESTTSTSFSGFQNTDTGTSESQVN